MKIMKGCCVRNAAAFIEILGKYGIILMIFTKVEILK